MLAGFQCRSCGDEQGDLLLDLGKQPRANRLLTETELLEPEPVHPLRLAICLNCHLLQIIDLVPPAELFNNYVYFSSYSETWMRHCEMSANHYMKEFGLNADSFVVEVASNDGCLLKHFKEAGVKHLGIEPAKNVAEVARVSGIQTITEFFGEATARRVRDDHGAANLLLGNNVFAHVPDINDFTAGIAVLLADDGVMVLEFPYALEMIEKAEFDTIYHEHVFYFTLTAINPVLARHGLTAWRVERLPTHGGSIRLFLARENAKPIEESVTKMQADELARGVTSLKYYKKFSDRVEVIRKSLIVEIDEWRKHGEVAAYGAAAKGSTLLNYCDLDTDSIAFVVDRSPHKQGMFMPGVQIPIRPVEELVSCQPAAVVLLTWNFEMEILAQQAAFREAGGKFIIPIPKVRAV